MDKTLEQIRSYAEQGRYKRVPISKELYADAFTPISVMRTLRAASKHCYLLESAEDRQQWGRYSFLGYAPTMEITCTDGRVIISEGHEDEDKTRREVLTDHPGKVLREILEAYKSPVVPELPPFTGGLVGYFSYDYIKYAELTLKPVLEEKNETSGKTAAKTAVRDFRDADLMLFDRVIVFDNYRQKLILITGVKLEGDLEENYTNAKQELEEMERLIRSGAQADFRPLVLEEEFHPGVDKEDYCKMVEKAKEYIYEGDIFQVVLSNPLTAKAKGSLFDTYRVLRTSNPSPYMFYFSSDDIEVAGASPETLAKLENGQVCTAVLLDKDLNVQYSGNVPAANQILRRGQNFYLLTDSGVECFTADGVYQWGQTLSVRPQALIAGKQLLVLCGNTVQQIAPPEQTASSAQ